MQYLRVLAIPAVDGQFDVYWTNTTLESVRGIAHVYVPPGDDRAVIAELYTLQYLLEVEEVIGSNLAGGDVNKLVVSSGAIKKLARKVCAKQSLVKHAIFLTTRFNGCRLDVKKDSGWTKYLEDRVKRVTLDASAPHEETIVVNGVGEVSLTSHAVEQFAIRVAEERSTHFSMGEAWRLLRSMAADKRVQEIERTYAAKRIKYALKGIQEGRYFLQPSNGWIFVCTKHDHQKRLALVTAYQQEQIGQ